MATGDSLFSRDGHLNRLEDNCPRIYSCQSRSIFFTRSFVTGHSLAVVRFGARYSARRDYLEATIARRTTNKPNIGWRPLARDYETYATWLTRRVLVRSFFSFFNFHLRGDLGSDDLLLRKQSYRPSKSSERYFLENFTLLVVRYTHACVYKFCSTRLGIPGRISIRIFLRKRNTIFWDIFFVLCLLIER